MGTLQLRYVSWLSILVICCIHTYKHISKPQGWNQEAIQQVNTSKQVDQQSVWRNTSLNKSFKKTPKSWWSLHNGLGSLQWYHSLDSCHPEGSSIRKDGVYRFCWKSCELWKRISCTSWETWASNNAPKVYIHEKPQLEWRWGNILDQNSKGRQSQSS